MTWLDFVTRHLSDNKQQVMWPQPLHSYWPLKLISMQVTVRGLYNPPPPNVHYLEPPSQWVIGLSGDQFEQATSSAPDGGKRLKEWVESLTFYSGIFSAKASQKWMGTERERDGDRMGEMVGRDTRCALFRSDSLDGDSQAWHVA